MKHLFSIVLIILAIITGRAQSNVYFTSEISPESLVKIYQALGVEAKGNVAVKISTGESSRSNHLSPELIKDLVQAVNGTLVECNTAYRGNRNNTASHLREIEERGYNKIANVDIMDSEGEITIPVSDTKWLDNDIVGSHISNYDFMINLAHFKGHAMGGFGGVLKNASIGVASSRGKSYIHSAGNKTSGSGADQDSFLESMAAAAQAVHNYFKQDGKDIVYINVMNNMSVDCDCDGNPHAPELKDMGILASTDPVALDRACLDLVFNHESVSGDDASALIRRIENLHGTHTVEYAEQIGLGTQAYNLINLDESGESGIEEVEKNSTTNVYNVYDINGIKVLDKAKNLAGLEKGIYVVNGKNRLSIEVVIL